MADSGDGPAERRREPRPPRVDQPDATAPLVTEPPLHSPGEQRPALEGLFPEHELFRLLHLLHHPIAGPADLFGFQQHPDLRDPTPQLFAQELVGRLLQLLLQLGDTVLQHGFKIGPGHGLLPRPLHVLVTRKTLAGFLQLQPRLPLRQLPHLLLVEDPGIRSSHRPTDQRLHDSSFRAIKALSLFASLFSRG